MLYKQENDHYTTPHLLIIIIVVVFLFLLVFIIIVVIVVGLLLCLGRGFSCRPRAPLGLLAVRSNVLWWDTVNKLETRKDLHSQSSADVQGLTFSYFSFSLLAFFSYGCLSSELVLFHSSPSFLATSPMERPGCSLFTLGRNSEQKMKKADLKSKKNTLSHCSTETWKCIRVCTLTGVSWGHWGPWTSSSSCLL